MFNTKPSSKKIEWEDNFILKSLVKAWDLTHNWLVIFHDNPLDAVHFLHANSFYRKTAVFFNNFTSFTIYFNSMTVLG